MNYKKIYNDIIYKRQYLNVLDDHTTTKFETHHIIPKSIDLSLANDKSNLVNLTLKEHYICHQLLVKIYENEFGKESLQYNKMITALYGMSNYSKYGKILSAKQYEKLRTEFSKSQSRILKLAWQNYPKDKMEKLRKIRSINAKGENNPMYRKSWKDGKTEDEILQHSINTSIGLNKRTKEQKIESQQKYANTIKNYSKEKHDSVNKKRVESRNKFYKEHPDKLLNYLETLRNICKKRTGTRKMFKENETPVYVSKEDIQKYLDNGWKFSLHEKDITNPTFGRRWMHLKGSSKKEDRVYVKVDSIKKYLDLGYIFGIKD